MKLPTYLKIGDNINVEGARVSVRHLTEDGIIYNHPQRGICSRRWDCLTEVSKNHFIWTEDLAR